MTQVEKELLVKYLCMALPYGVMIEGLERPEVMTIKHLAIISAMSAEPYKPYLRPMSSMTDEEKEELLNAVVGEDAIKYFQVLPDGSIDNTDTAHQDLYNFTMHWVNFDATNTSSYLNWLLENHFDFMGLIPKDLAIEVTEENNPYK